MLDTTSAFPTGTAGATIPLPPALAALTVPERMHAVILRQTLAGLSTTREDFHQAEETCDLTDGQLDANIGHAKRLANRGVLRHDQPTTPVHPWDHDLDYRAERVRFGASVIAGQLIDPGSRLVALRNRNFSAREVGDLWTEIMAELDRQLQTVAIPQPSAEDMRRIFA